tara:strand:- start:94 stop:987 length:894 start_codon:yes stop_codon:yes gene_type:complete
MGKNKINFSVVLPTYNCNYVSRSIESVLKQSYKHWELLIIDNNSKNLYFKKIKSYKDKRIRYFKINNKGIIAKSRNLGVKKSKFNWVAFLDSDDYWKKNKLQSIYDHIIKNKADLYYHNLIINEINSNSRKNCLYDGKIKINKPILDNLILFGNKIPQSSVVVKKKLIEKVKYISEKKNYVTWEDFDLWIKISKITNKFYFIKNKLGFYWVDDKKLKKLKNYIKIINNFEKYYSNDINIIKNKYRKKNLDWVNLSKSIYYFKTKKFKKGIHFLKKLSKKEIIHSYKNYLKKKIIYPK